MSARKLNKQELELLTKLYGDETLCGRGAIRKFIIRNTYEPKYKVGDYVKITDETYTYIWGNRIVNVNAKITEINWWLNDKGSEFVQYGCVAYDQFGKDHYLVAQESINGSYQRSHIVCASDTDQNTFEKKTKVSDSCSL